MVRYNFDITTPLSTPYRQALAYSQACAGLSLLICQAGQVVFADYAPGIQPDQPLAIASGTKSMAAVLAALMIQSGWLKSWDEPVANTLVEWQADAGKAQITLRHLLSLTSGLPGGRSTLFGGTIPTYTQASHTQPHCSCGQRFQYGPVPFQVLGAVFRQQLLSRGYLPDPTLWLQQHLLTPLQIQIGDWTRDQEGFPHLASGIHMSAANWAKFGQFIVNPKSHLEPDLLQACFRGSSVNPAYGLGFWLNQEGLNVAGRPWRAIPHQPANLVMALGAGNQNLYILPDQELVIVRQGELKLPIPEFDHNQFLALISAT